MLRAIKGTCLAVMLLVASGCAHDQISAGVPDIIVPRPSPIVTETPQVLVVNRDNLQEFTSMVQSGQVTITMPIEEFNKIVRNNQQVMVHIANQNAVIDVYEGRILNPN